MVKSSRTRPAEPRERLRKLKQAHGVSYAQLARLIGRNAAYLQQFVERGSPRELGERDRRMLAGFFGVDEMELGASEENSFDSNWSGGGWVDVPRLALDASAGPGALVAEEIPYDTFRFSRRWLAEQNLAANELSSITVAGDSMEPLIRAGDEILVDRTPRPLRDGIHVVRLGEVLHVKRLQAGPPGRVTLISANEAYPPMEVALADVDIIGRVVWKGGRV
jgi:phage repressor protein C with HTH and peptisase S24 domain